MGRPLYTNNAATYLAFGITNTATTMQVSANAGSLFPNPTGGDYFYVSLISLSGPIIEIVKCTARSGDIFTIERGQEGTSALYWNMGDNVQLRITAAGMNFVTGEADTVLAELAAPTGSSLIGYTEGGTGAVTRTVQSKLQESISVQDFGAIGDGTTDDTVAIQAALNSGASQINFASGKTFLINGGLTTNTSNQTIIATGATIKLKDNAGYPVMISANANYVTFDGGIWDGNKTGGNTLSIYASKGISVIGDNCTVKNIVSINTFGIGIFGIGNYISFLNNKITNTTGYGIFVDKVVSTDYYGNKAIGNYIDMSEGGDFGQGILFTAGIGNNQINWEISDNSVIGPQGSLSTQPICLGVRGENGFVSNNTTRYGSMGWSEGGSNTIISRNSFLYAAYAGVEISGSNVVVSNNVISSIATIADNFGILASGAAIVDNMVITGNNINASSKAIGFEMGVSGSAQNCIISNNYLKGSGFLILEFFRNCNNISITGNTIIGGNPAFDNGNGIYFGPFSAGTFNLNAFISGNTISNVQRPFSLYSDGTVTTVNNAYATGNNLALSGIDGNSFYWNVDGTGITLGTNVIAAYNVNCAGQGVEFSVLDQATNLIVRYGAYSPNGSVTGGLGSIWIDTLGGSGTTLWIKESGANTDTGWVGK